MPAEFKLDGLESALRNLEEFAEEFGGRKAIVVLGGALSKSVTPTMREMRTAAPRGKFAHKTYTGRWVRPGYLKSAIKRRRTTRGGIPAVILGVEKEAFYGVTFLQHGIAGKGRTKPVDWFEGVFERKVGEMTRLFVGEIGPKIKLTARKLRNKQKL